MTDHSYHNNAPHNHASRRGSFVPGEILLVAKLLPGVHAEPKTEDIQHWLTTLWNKAKESVSGGLAELDITVQDAAVIPLNNAEYLVPAVVPSLHTTLNNYLEADQNDALEKDGAVHDRLLLDTIASLNALEGDTRNSDGLMLNFAAPNWLVTGCGHLFSHLGPGAYPVPVNAGDLTAQRHEFDKQKPNDAIAERHRMAGTTRAAQKAQPGSTPVVNVVIFDSAPDEVQYEQALMDFPNHSLLKELNKQLTIKRAHDLNITLPPDPNQNPRRHFTNKDGYDVRDHGLFIAGTIHDLAPEAKIYLVEIQNRFGVGTITSLIQGLQALIDQQIVATSGSMLIVNCSLGITYDGADAQAAAELCYLEHLIQQLATCSRQYRVIAAAGNDAAAKARYPAALDSVVGVGAIDKDGIQTWYSNPADLPSHDGIMTFGGNATNTVPPLTKTGDDGMLGIYTGEFPPNKTPSVNGWAWWSGTSFATGVISGMFARAALDDCDIGRGSPNDFYTALVAEKDGADARGTPFVKMKQG